MLAMDLSTCRDALLQHPAVQRVDITEGTLVITAHTTGPWVLAATNIAAGILPVFHLMRPKELIGQLAHVNFQGEVCFTDREGISVDVDLPEQVLSTAFNEALTVLDRSLAAQRSGNLTELNDELEGYWQSLPGVSKAATHVEIDRPDTREIDAYLDRHGSVSFTDRGLKATYGSYRVLMRDKTLRRERAIYIPLSKSIALPTPNSPLSAAHVRTWAENARDLPSLQRILKSWPRRVNEAFIIFSAPRSDGSLSAVAVSLKGTTGRHPLLDTGTAWKAEPVRIERHAPNYLRARGGAHDLRAKRVVVIGAGSVGGRVVEQLAQAGVGKLTVVDPERLEPDNVYRHVLGIEYCGEYKAFGLRVSLEFRLPGVQVVPVISTLDGWLQSADLDAVDAIVIAIGHPNAERGFNRGLWGKLKPGTPYVTSWLEPLGLGGHAQLTRAGQAGCLECLYTDAHGESLLYPKTAYTVPGQRITRNLTGCGGAFTPYGNLDAVQTATEASRLILAALQSGQTATYSSWRGASDEATLAGIATTPWYQKADPGAAQEYSRVRCPVCGGNQ